MTTGRSTVVEAGRIRIGDFYYYLREPIISTSGPKYAPKIVQGPQSMDAHEDVSYLRWEDFSEGIGLEEFFIVGGETPKRAWYGTANLSSPGHTTLGQLVTQTTSVEGTFSAGADAGDEPDLVIFAQEVYMIVRNTVSATDRVRIYKYNNSTDSWGSVLHTMPAGCEDRTRDIDLKVGFVGGTEYIIACAGTTYAYSSDGSSWTDSTKGTMRITFHDDAFWGIDRTGQLFTATTLGTNTNKAQLPVHPVSSTTDPAYISDLVTLPDASGLPAVWCTTAAGLYQYDQTNDKWLKSPFSLPEARCNGRGTDVWNADMYVPAGMGLWRGIFGTETQFIPIGPDRDFGLPDINRGAIVDLAPGHDIIVAALDGSFTDFRNFVTTATDMRSVVLAYDGRGWKVLWESSTASERTKKCIIGSAYDEYRLWFSTETDTSGRDVYFIDLPTERLNPHQAQSLTYAASSTLITPWARVGQDVDGLGLSLVLELHNASAGETVQAEYEINYSGTFISLDTITSDSPYEILLSDTGGIPNGILFDAIRFRLTFSRGGTATNRPYVHGLTLKFLRIIEPRTTHIVSLDLTRESQGFSARGQLSNLRNTIEDRQLIEVTFRDDDIISSEDRYWCRVRNWRSILQTGFNYQGQVDLELSEVQRVVGGIWDVDNWDEFLWG